MAKTKAYGEESFATWDGLYGYYVDRFSRGHKQWIFKGHANSDWHLRTTLERAFTRLLGRAIRAKGRNREEGLDALYRELAKAGVGDKKKRPLSEIEGGLLRDFKRKCHHYLQDVPPDEHTLEWLTLMQHHGAPTRLLDFTYSFFVALYFAVEEAEGECAVWAIDSHWLSGLNWNAGLFDTKEEWREFKKMGKFTTREGMERVFKKFFWRSVKPRVEVLNTFRLNQRLIMQQGVFLCPGDISMPFMDNLWTLLEGHWDTNKFVKLKIRLSSRERKTVLQQLHRMNITRATLFPGLDGFAKSLANLLIFPDILRPETDEVCEGT